MFIPIRTSLEEHLSEVQFGFKAGLLHDSFNLKRHLTYLTYPHISKKAPVHLVNEVSDIFAIDKGRLLLSPIYSFFNIYAENLFWDVFDELVDDITANGELVNNIRYADDIALLEDSMEGFHRVIYNVELSNEMAWN